MRFIRVGVRSHAWFMLSLPALLAAAMLASPSAHASDGTITITGQVTANTCTINAGGTSSANATLVLPTVSTAALSTVGSKAGATPLTISFSGCSTGLTGATVYFEASGIEDFTSGCLSNTATASASNVEACVMNLDGSSAVLGKPSGSQGVTTATLTSGAGSQTFLVAYYAANAAATAGAFSSQVTYSVIYQ